MSCVWNLVAMLMLYIEDSRKVREKLDGKEGGKGREGGEREERGEGEKTEISQAQENKQKITCEGAGGH